MTRDEVLRLLSAHQDEIKQLGVKSLAIFGSVSRDEAGDSSDVDLLVEFDKPIGLFKFLDVKAYLESILGREVDLGTPDALKSRIRPAVLKEAVRAL